MKTLKIVTYYFEENNLVVGTYSADEEYTWEVIGTDADLFTFSSEGVLSFKTAPDYENPSDSDQDNTYVGTLTATDADGNQFSGEGKIFVTDLEEEVTTVNTEAESIQPLLHLIPTQPLFPETK